MCRYLCLEGEEEKCASRNDVALLGPPVEREDDKCASRNNVALGPPLVSKGDFLQGEGEEISLKIPPDLPI
jgi:hypothetical protein